MEIFIDARESFLLEKLQHTSFLRPRPFSFSVRNLEIGDVLFVTPDRLVILERKTERDLLQSLHSGRLHSQKERMMAFQQSQASLVRTVLLIEESPEAKTTEECTRIRQWMLRQSVLKDDVNAVLFSKGVFETLRSLKDIARLLEKTDDSKSSASSWKSLVQENLKGYKRSTFLHETCAAQQLTLLSSLFSIQGVSSKTVEKILAADPKATLFSLFCRFRTRIEFYTFLREVVALGKVQSERIAQAFFPS